MENLMSTKKLKVKFTIRKPDTGSCDSRIKSMAGNSQCISAYENGKVELGKLKKCDLRKPLEADHGEKMLSTRGTKRVAEQTLDLHVHKRLKMDCRMNRKCSVILKKLMSHQYAWIFNKPVDPVALKIPDYFSIISHPMDLGTIKSKLEKNIYTAAEEFESDVKLTFSNAMRYNPPCNDVHHMAEELKTLFGTLWRSMLDGQSLVADQNALRDKKQLDDVDGGYDKLASGDVLMSHRRPTLSTEKVNVEGPKEESYKKNVRRKDIKAMEPQGKGTVVNKVPKMNGPNPGSQGRSSSVVKTACSSLKSGDALSRISTQPLTEMKPLETREGLGRKKAPLSGTLIRKQLPSFDPRTHEKTSEERDRHSKAPQMSKPDPDSDGAVSCVDEEHTSSHPDVTLPSSVAASEDFQNTIYEMQLSPSKRLRAAMLKKRFAATIFKAQQQTLLHMDGKVNSFKMSQEKEKLKSMQREEEARIEAQIEASKIKQESKLWSQRQQEREAARIALERMEKSVEFEDNICILRDLAMLIGDSSFAGPLRGCGGMYVSANQFINGKLKSPLERLGLFLKDDDAFGDDDYGEGGNFQSGDYEEGELVA